ncbi:hypothetical protein SYJ56_24750 [Algoriphagus sp. D3-2-R+10]|uniref:hypothetical protein n=1 Tax=Algoriphagus aurantiacus TaxID=3103948 RepID=UPI002B3D5BA4|nr:hypothetical protein [Algoriphagus sp. D3-2-R+10]MEB2778542.1 hypothetical protein [Algoriphagus sp. D3-2-R+10]
MYNWAEICSELKVLEKKAEEKHDKIRFSTPYPIPYDRLRKGKEIIALSKSIRLLMDQDLDKDAEMIPGILLEKGIRLKSVRT